MTTELELEKIYKGYLAAINNGHLDQMDEFVAEQCIFNGLKVNPQEYGEYVTSFTNRCEEGLRFELVDLVIDAAKGRLASKLVVSGKPVTDFFGLEPTGHEVSFDEAAFYTFRDGKIVQVYTIVDRGDIADTLAGGRRNSISMLAEQFSNGSSS